MKYDQAKDTDKWCESSYLQKQCWGKIEFKIFEEFVNESHIVVIRKIHN